MYRGCFIVNLQLAWLRRIRLWLVGMDLYTYGCLCANGVKVRVLGCL